MPVSVAQVQQLLAAQFPSWRDLPVREVPSHGTVNALFRLGDDLVARFPLHPTDPQRVADEAEAARHLHAISPYPTPAPVAVVADPTPWSVYTWLDGSTAYDADVSGSIGFAEDLARFIRALRAEPTEGRTFTGTWRGGLLTSQDESVADGLARSHHLIDTAALADLWADLRETPRTEPDTWTHRDLMPGNLLAVDGSDDAEWRRGMGWAFAQAIGCLWYYVETNPVMSRTAHHTLSALLATNTNSFPGRSGASRT